VSSPTDTLWADLVNFCPGWLGDHGHLAPMRHDVEDATPVTDYLTVMSR